MLFLPGHVGSLQIFRTVRGLFSAVWPVVRPIKTFKSHLLSPNARHVS